MKTARIFFALMILCVPGLVRAELSPSDGTTGKLIKVWITKEECEQAVGGKCEFVTCDYAPHGKTLSDIRCIKNATEGWWPIRHEAQKYWESQEECEKIYRKKCRSACQHIPPTQDHDAPSEIVCPKDFPWSWEPVPENAKKPASDGSIYNTVKSWPTREECEQATGGKCRFMMCDYIPPGRTYEEMCGPGSGKGWQPMQDRTNNAPR